MATAVRSSLFAALLAMATLASSGCAGVLEADLNAADTLSRNDSSQRDKIIAGSVIGGTVAAAIAIAAISVAATSGKKNPPKAEPGERVDVGWNVERNGDEVAWRHCRTIAICGEDARVAPASSVVAIEKVGATSPMFPDGSLGEGVMVYRVHIRDTP